MSWVKTLIPSLCPIVVGENPNPLPLFVVDPAPKPLGSLLFAQEQLHQQYFFQLEFPQGNISFCPILEPVYFSRCPSGHTPSVLPLRVIVIYYFSWQLR